MVEVIIAYVAGLISGITFVMLLMYKLRADARKRKGAKKNRSKKTVLRANRQTRIGKFIFNLFKKEKKNNIIYLSDYYNRAKKRGINDKEFSKFFIIQESVTTHTQKKSVAGRRGKTES